MQKCLLVSQADILACWAITFAYIGRWLPCLQRRIWHHQARRSHRPVKPMFHHLRIEQCLYRSRRVTPRPGRDRPSGREFRQDRLALGALVHLMDQLALVGPGDPEWVVHILQVQAW